MEPSNEYNLEMNKFMNRFKIVNNIKHNNDKTLIWFTDGSCTGNGKNTAKGGFASICVNGYKANNIIYGKIDNHHVKASNIRAEGIAIQTVLNELKKCINSNNWTTAIIYSDSQFWEKMLYNYMPSWTAGKFEQKANPDLTKSIYNIWKELQRSNKIIKVEHIYAHNKDNSATSSDPFKRYCHDNNELADILAGIARELPDYNICNEVLCLD